MFSLVIFSTFASVVLYFTVKLFSKNIFEYWRKKGVKQLSPVFPVGDLLQLVKQEMSTGDFYQHLYEKTKENRFIGIYNFTKPSLLVNDPELIKQILVRDFSYFTDRGVYSNEKADPLSGTIFHLSGQRWRTMRAKLTPIFTSGKIKGMWSTMFQSAQNLQKFIQTETVKDSKVFEVRDLMARYATDIISSVGFGLEIDSINKPDEQIREVGRKLFEMTPMNCVRFLGQLFVPSLFKFLGLKSVDRKVEEFFLPLIKENIQFRETNQIVRKDFIQLMVQLRNMGNIKLTDDWTSEVTGNDKRLTLNEVAAQSFVFWAAGFETTSTTMSFCLFELARNPEILQNLQNSIDEILVKHNGELTYEALQQMTYLDNCIDETLRKYPPLPVLQRQCLHSYQVPGSEVTIDPETIVYFPIIGLQRDNDLYPNPTQFIPERFTDPTYERILKSAYFPFGDGPRNCIAFRLGKIMVKLGVAAIVSKFNIVSTDTVDQREELKLNRHALLLAPENGINLKLTSRFQ